MTIPIHLTEISTFEWSENEKSVTKPPFWRRVQDAWPFRTRQESNGPAVIFN